MSLKTTGLMISLGMVFAGATALSTTNTAIDKLSLKVSKLQSTKVELKLNPEAYDIATKKVDTLTKAIDKLKSNKAKIELNSLKMNEFENSMGKRIAMGVSAIVPIKLAVDFETSMSDVKKVVDFSSKEEAKGFENEILKLSTKIPIDATGLSEIVASGGSLGIAKEKLLDFTQLTAKMSTAFGMGTAEAGKSSASLMNVFKLSIDELGSLGDAINYLSDKSASEAKDLVDVVAKVGGSAKVFGISAEQTASLANAFLAMGKPVEVTGTAINSMLGILGSADKQGAKFQDGLAQIGLSSEELKANIQKNGEGAIVDFLTRLNGVDKADKMGVLTDLFGREYADAIALITEGMDNYTDAISLLSDKTKYQGSMQREFEIRSATTGNQLTLLKNSVVRVGISLGTTLLPAIQFVTGKLKIFSDFIGEASIKYPALTSAISGIAFGVVSLAVVIPTLGYAWYFASNGLLKFKSMLTIVTALLKVSTYTTAFNTTVTKLHTVWMGISTTTTKAWTFAKKIAIGTINAFKFTVISTTVVTKFFIASLHLGAVASKVFATATLLLNKAFTIAKIGIKTLIGATGIGLLFVAVGLIYEYWEPIKGFFVGLWDNIKIGFNDGVNFISNIFTNPIETITNLWDGLFNWLGSKFEWVSKSIDWVKGIGSDIGNFFGSSKETIKNTALTTATATSLMIAPVQQMELKEQPLNQLGNQYSPNIPLKTQKQLNSTSANNNNYSITINVNNPTSNIDIENAVKKAIQDMQRDKFNREIS